MPSGRFVSYLRVSTQKQGRSGLGLEAQRALVAGYLNAGDWQLLGEFTEIESGRKADRPELAKALQRAKLTGATLVIAKLDRLGRNVHFISGLMESGVDFVVADMPAVNKLTIHILAAVAEEEAKMISARTKAALAAAKARGVKLGGRHPGSHNFTHADAMAGAQAKKKRARQRADHLAPVVLDIQAAGHRSTRAIAAELNARGIRTARGGPWSHGQVAPLLRLLAAQPLDGASLHAAGVAA